MRLGTSVAPPSDLWRLTGTDDPSTPPSVARVLNAAGSRAEWRRAGLPVLFDDAGRPMPVQRNGRQYRFESVGEDEAARAPRPAPLRDEAAWLQPYPSPLNEH